VGSILYLGRATRKPSFAAQKGRKLIVTAGQLGGRNRRKKFDAHYIDAVFPVKCQDKLLNAEKTGSASPLNILNAGSRRQEPLGPFASWALAIGVKSAQIARKKIPPGPPKSAL